MTLIWIAGIALALSIVGIITILIRKFPLAAAVDTEQAPVSTLKKDQIVETRLRRKLHTFWSRVQDRSRPMAQSLGGMMAKTQSKLRDLEHEYKVRSLPVLLNRRQRRRVNEEVQTILDQADSLLTDKEHKAAEEKCLQAVRMEPRSIPAFDFLGELYLANKEYAHAKEVYKFLEKLTEESDAIYDHHSDEANAAALSQAESIKIRFAERMAEAYRGLEDLPAAFESIQTAYRLAPTNPKILDTFIDIAIKLEKKAFASDALAQLQSVNPENSKIEEFATAIAALPETHLTDSNESSTT